jgi:hypothetical protein
MSKKMNKHATKRKSAPENSILKFLTVSSVSYSSSDSIVKGIIDDIIKAAVKTAEGEGDEQKTKRKHEKVNEKTLEDWKRKFPWLRTTDYKGTTRVKCASCTTAKLDNVWTNVMGQ